MDQTLYALPPGQNHANSERVMLPNRHQSYGGPCGQTCSQRGGIVYIKRSTHRFFGACICGLVEIGASLHCVVVFDTTKARTSGGGSSSLHS